MAMIHLLLKPSMPTGGSKGMKYCQETLLPEKETYIENSSVITVDSFGLSFFPINKADENLLSFDRMGEQILVEIKGTPSSCLVANILTANKFNLVIKNGACAHIVINGINDFSQEINLQVEPFGKAYLYFLSPLSLVNLKQSLWAKISHDAQLTICELTYSFGINSRSMNIELMEKQAQVSYLGLDYLSETSLKKSILNIFHHAPQTISSQTFRGIYSGQAHGTFLGKVIVGKSANQSCADQLYKAVLLDEQAKAHVMPQLEIYNYDISARHGASIGELDKNSLFYLCSRGLSMVDAKSILVMGLLNDILDKIEEVSIKKTIKEQLKNSIGYSLRMEA
jgi:hypothetical protein